MKQAIIKTNIDHCGVRCPHYESETDTGHGCITYYYCTKSKREIYGKAYPFPEWCELEEVDE